MWGKVDVMKGELTSPSQVYNDLFKFHRVGTLYHPVQHRMVQSTERPDECRPSNHRHGDVLCRCHLCHDSQDQSLVYVWRGPPG